MSADWQRAVIYVLAIAPQLRGRLTEYSRLYAYPAEPEPPAADGFVILDSGAFGLAQAGGRMNDAYIQKLRAHYERHAGARVLCIAPDEYLNPHISMRRFADWHERGGPPVAPVVQFPAAHRLDALAALRQARFYAQYVDLLPRYGGRPVVAISNPGLRAFEAPAKVWRSIAQTARRLVPGAWLHVLGAGWDLRDIRAWSELACFDSIDSIAYYTAAQAGEAWSEAGDRWADTAVANAHAAQRIVRAARPA